MKSSIARFRGFAIVSAIFILVVLAALGAFIVNISTSQQIGSALDVQGVRAYQAAHAGIEWGLYRVTRDGPTDDGTNYAAMVAIPAPAANGLSWCSSTSAAAPSRSSFDFSSSSAETLKSFTVTVECYATKNASGAPWVFSIRSTACNKPNAAEPKCPNTTSPGALYIERRLDVAL